MNTKFAGKGAGLFVLLSIAAFIGHGLRRGDPGET
jgi:hypothetical protein